MRNKLTLQDVEWREFRIKDVFEVSNSKPYHKSNLKSVDGIGIQYITRTSFNNGLEDIVENDMRYNKNKKNTISLGAENADFFYHEQEYICGNKMYVIYNKNINKYNGKFLVSVFRKSIKNCGFGYGQGLTGTRFKERIILLPIDKNGNPNWQFMEDYIKQEQREITEKVVNYYQNKLNEILENGSGGALQPIEYKDTLWKVFEFNDIFREIKRGKRLTKANQINGKTPYISSSAINNGVDNFISNDEKVRKFDNCLSIANSGSVGACFYHKYEYVASDHITTLKLDNENSDEYIYLFMAGIIKRLEEKYSFNREINDSRIQREKLILPADENGNPDFNYMRNFVINMQKENIEKTLNYIYIISTIIAIYKDKYSLKNIQWREFFIEDLFEIKSGVRLTKADQTIGKIAFIGATDSNNGITEFVSNKNASLDNNVLGVNYNGSVGETFYHSYECVFSDDVKRLKLKNKRVNKWINLFLKQSILQQKNKYRYGYKFNANRMKRQIMLLPVDHNANPNYDFMENYIKFREFQKYINIVEYLS